MVPRFRKGDVTPDEVLGRCVEFITVSELYCRRCSWCVASDTCPFVPLTSVTPSKSSAQREATSAIALCCCIHTPLINLVWQCVLTAIQQLHSQSQQLSVALLRGSRMDEAEEFFDTVEDDEWEQGR